MAPNDELKRKPRTQTMPYKRRTKAFKDTEAPKTSAIQQKDTKLVNPFLTLHDWLTVVGFCDKNLSWSQEDIVNYFKNRPEGSLIFTQSALSRHLTTKGHENDQKKLQSNLTALSAKRLRIVTRPDVEKALIFWVQHIEEKGEHVTGAMLQAKRERFENYLNVLDTERLKSGGWIQNFCKTYKLKDIRRHGEAGSVDIGAVATEHERVAKIFKKFAARDRFNFDETGLFGFAPPDRGLASKQMSGKKSSKTRITVALACNADGSEKLPVFFIGKSKQPRCFGKTSPAQRGFYYQNNKTAWMTAEYFEEWIKIQDQRFRQQKQKICLIIDNFLGHTIRYVPTNIQLEFFEPNMTSFVQLLDAGIIRCMKAHYRKEFSLCAIELDEAGEEDIHKINLLEVMLMVQAAWDAVTLETIANCWKHTGIQGLQSTKESAILVPAPTETPSADLKAWDIVLAFAEGRDNVTYPQTIERMKAHLKECYCKADWNLAYDAVFNAETDACKAIADVQKLSDVARRCIKPGAKDGSNKYTTPQLAVLEVELMDTIDQLRSRMPVRTRGERPTLEDLLNPVEERDIGYSPYRFHGGDKEIVEAALKAVATNQEPNEFPINVDEDEDIDEVDEIEKTVSIREGIAACEKLEKLCVLHSNVHGLLVLELQKQLRRLRTHLRF